MHHSEGQGLMTYVKMGAIEDGYIPGFQSEYQQIPQEGF